MQKSAKRGHIVPKVQEEAERATGQKVPKRDTGHKTKKHKNKHQKIETLSTREANKGKQTMEATKEKCGAKEEAQGRGWRSVLKGRTGLGKGGEERGDKE